MILEIIQMILTGQSAGAEFMRIGLLAILFLDVCFFLNRPQGKPLWHFVVGPIVCAVGLFFAMGCFVYGPEYCILN